MTQFPTADVEGFRDQLKEIQGTMVDGQFLGEDSTAPTGQAIVAGLLDRCLLWSDIVLTRYVNVRTAVTDHLLVVTSTQGKERSTNGSKRHSTSWLRFEISWKDFH
jgi:hypothetical protein